MIHKTAALLVTTLPLLAAACASGTSGAGAVSPAPSETEPAPAAAEVASSVPAPDATLAGIYSEDQAERGQGTFRSVCGECHYSRELRDDQFKFSWRRRSVADLFQHIAETMPENAPGSLSSRQYADVVAYILKLNGIPAGTEDLPADVDALDAYTLAALAGN